MGGTIVLVGACSSSEPREGISILPLTVDYEGRLYAELANYRVPEVEDVVKVGSQASAEEGRSSLR